MSDDKKGCADCEARRKARAATATPPPANGSLLYWDADGKTYRPLAPGPDGSTLQMVNGVPTWVA